jgi:ribosome-associated heat shock protein Hsp15
MVRVDKWLWAVRVYKTRSMATDACRRGHVLVNGMTAKPSKEIKENDHITVRKLPVLFSYVVKQAIEKRIAAKLVTDCLQDITSLEELDKLKVKETYFIKRDRGSGRPTKKERRLLDRVDNNLFD